MTYKGVNERDTSEGGLYRFGEAYGVEADGGGLCYEELDTDRTAEGFPERGSGDRLHASAANVRQVRGTIG